MTFEKFWEKETQKRYPIGDTRWPLEALKELAKCAYGKQVETIYKIKRIHKFP